MNKPNFINPHRWSSARVKRPFSTAEILQRLRERKPTETKPIEELDRRQCRYPHGDRGNYTFCAQPVHPGSSYCRDHAHLCYLESEQLYGALQVVDTKED